MANKKNETAVATTSNAVAANNVLTFGERSVQMHNNLYGLMNIPANKSYYATAQTIVQTANGIETAVDINRLQCQLFAEAQASADMVKDFKTIEEFIKVLDIPQFFKTDKDGNTVFAKQRVSQMCAAGIVYNDDKAPDALKRLPWSVLGAIGAQIRKADERAILYAAVESGEVTITKQDEARAYAKKRAEEIAANKGKGKNANNDTDANKDTGANKDEPFYLLEICSDGAFHASYDVDENGVVTFGKSIEDVNKTLANMASVMISDADFTEARKLADGKSYGAIVSTTGDATVYRIREVEQKSITMPPASTIAGMREAIAIMTRAGMVVDEKDRLIVDIADMLGW